MMIALYGHPFSSYTWKALIALYEKGLEFDFRVLDAGEPVHPEHGERLRAIWPPGKFPVIEDGGQAVIESSIIIEHLDLHHPGPRMIPADPALALEVRLMDRVFDNHVMSMMQAIVGEYLPFITPQPDPAKIARVKGLLDTIYGWLDQRLPEYGWACGGGFSMADCAAAPALFYADWVHPIAECHPTLRAYRARLLARPSVSRCVEEARPYRWMFPLGAPDRD
ncbi:MAG: glutathione S-transferase family protein [Proteobacteria bacterium]|nr:glutathione S-transferase family protein [Pseudomonadota bacterium]